MSYSLYLDDTTQPSATEVIGPQGSGLFIGVAAPVRDGQYLWLDTSSTDLTLWFEDDV